MDEGRYVLVVFVPLMVILTGGVLIVLMGMFMRSRTLEMKHRERLAMIEKGLMPGPAHDPEAFESWPHRHDVPAPSRSTTLGVMVIALGLGFMLIVGFAGGAAGAAIGVGGAIVIVGAAFIVNGALQRQAAPRSGGPGGYSATPPPPGSAGQGDRFGR